MSAAAHAVMRRGACPGLSAPMPTGDGLLARLRPDATVALDAMLGLCDAARAHGNGIVEITSRGSIQVRGLTDATTFADAVAQFGIDAHDGVPVIAGPLAGLDPTELIGANALAAELRTALATQPLAHRLAPKISVAIDGGGALHLDALAADIRLRAIYDTRFDAAIGGDATVANPLGTVASTDAVETVVQLLDTIAAHGPHARARDVIFTERRDAPAPRSAANPIGQFNLRDGTVAIGVGFAFGHTDAATLADLVHAARATGANGLRPSPGRALLIVGVTADRAATLREAASALGFIIACNDPRRRVVACAGAPICGSAEIPARALAPQVAAHAASLLTTGEVIHISGCAKGCAHHGPATLTAIGRAGQCDLLVGDTPADCCAAAALPQRLGELAATRNVRHG
jgi:precorrin-3B synthase